MNEKCGVLGFQVRKQPTREKKCESEKSTESWKWDWSCMLGWEHPPIPISACSWWWRNNRVAPWWVFLAHTEDKHTWRQTRCWSHHKVIPYIQNTTQVRHRSDHWLFTHVAGPPPPPSQRLHNSSISHFEQQLTTPEQEKPMTRVNNQ